MHFSTLAVVAVSVFGGLASAFTKCQCTSKIGVDAALTQYSCAAFSSVATLQNGFCVCNGGKSNCLDIGNWSSQCTNQSLNYGATGKGTCT